MNQTLALGFAGNQPSNQPSNQFKSSQLNRNLMPDYFGFVKFININPVDRWMLDRSDDWESFKSFAGCFVTLFSWRFLYFSSSFKALSWDSRNLFNGFISRKSKWKKGNNNYNKIKKKYPNLLDSIWSRQIGLLILDSIFWQEPLDNSSVICFISF